MRRRRLLLAAPAALGACSVLPERPYREVQRFALAPERPEALPPRAGGPVLLVRPLRAAPAAAGRGLLLVDGGGQVTQEFYAEWTAPPAELVEEALRRWLAASGLFAAVIAPGSRLRATMVLEAELLRLHCEPAQDRARVALSALLLAEAPASGETRILAQAPVEGAAALGSPRPAPEAQAAALRMALGAALQELEQRLAPVVR